MDETEPTIEEMRAAWEAKQRAKAKAHEYSRRPEVKAKNKAKAHDYFHELMRLAKAAREAGL